jgi:dTDP-4-dehydrorhamnose 3,5-epimerase-like enzyme
MDCNGALRGIYGTLQYRRVCHQPQTIEKPRTRVAIPVDGCGHKPLIRSLNWHTDPRGALVEVHRSEWDGESIGTYVRDEGSVEQVYISMTRKGVVKGWHAHAKQTDRFTCIRGAVMVALCDLRPLILSDGTPELSIQTIVLDSNLNMQQLTIPPGVAHGWKALTEDARVLNVCSHHYDGTDEYRLEPDRHPADHWPNLIHFGPSYSKFDWSRDFSG